MNSPLDQLPDDEKRLVMALLSCVVDHADDFVNEVHHLGTTAGVQYFVQVREGQQPSVPHQYTHPTNAAPLLASLQLVIEAPPPRPRIDRRTRTAIPRPSQGFQLTPLALQAYCDAKSVSNAQIQRRIGEELYERWRRDRHRMGDEPIDVGAMSQELGIERDRFVDNLYILHHQGYVLEPPYSLQGALEQGYAYLSPDRGIGWANAGFPDIAQLSSTNVTVTVHVTLQQVIQEVEQLPISQEEKERFELLLRRFDEEARKGEPSYKPLQDALDMLSKVKELAPVGIRFFADHLDDIQRMAHHLPGM